MNKKKWRWKWKELGSPLLFFMAVEIAAVIVVALLLECWFCSEWRPPLASFLFLFVFAVMVGWTFLVSLFAEFLLVFFLVVLYWVCRGDLVVFSGFCFLLWVFPFLWDFWSFLPDGFFLEFIWGILWGFRVYFARKISVILGSLQGWKLKKNDVREEGDEGRKGVR